MIRNVVVVSTGLDTADPGTLERFAATASRSGDGLEQVRGRLQGMSIQPSADRFGLLTDLLRQHEDARRRVLSALTGLSGGCGDLNRSAKAFAEAFRVAMEVR